MADVSGASLSIARPIVNNNGVNQQRESELQQTDQQLRATAAPQQDRQINQQPADIPPEESISSRLDISVSANDNNTQENTTVTREQVVQAVEQQLQQNSVNANATRPTDDGATQVEQNTTERTNNQTSNQTSEQLANSNTQAAPQPEVTSEATEAAAAQPAATPSSQSQSVDNSEPLQANNETPVENTAPEPPDTTETTNARNPETGLGLESGTIINTTV